MGDDGSDGGRGKSEGEGGERREVTMVTQPEEAAGWICHKNHTHEVQT